MGLDADALCDVGIDRSLRQEGDVVLLAGFFFEHPDKLGTDDFALLLRIADTGQLIEEAIHGVHIDQVGVHLVAEHFDDLLGFALAQETVVDVNGDQLFADGFDQQGCHDGTVHAAGEGQQDLFAADLGADRFHLFIDESLGQFGCGDSFHAFRTLVIIHVLPPIKPLAYCEIKFNQKNRKRGGQCQSGIMTI